MHALLALACLLGSAPRAQEATASAPAIELETRPVELEDGGETPSEWGTIDVPLLRSAPDGVRLRVEVVRFPAVDGAPGPEEGVPPIFILHGGPGFTGMEEPLRSRGYYERRIAPYAELTDVVVVGQRGIGSSTDTSCGGDESPPLDAEDRAARTEELLVEACRACRAHWEEQGYDLRGFNVLEAAADVRDAAHALGYERIQLLGGSFGSHWGMTVLSRHPELVERAVLHGMEGPDHTYDMPGWVLAALRRMATEAEESEALAGLVPDGGILAAFEGAIDRVEHEPVMLELTIPPSRKVHRVRITADVLRDRALGVRSRVSSRRGMPTWAADLLRIADGDYGSVARALIRGSGGGGLPTAAFFGLDCGSGISPERLAILDADPAAHVVGRLGDWYQTTCAQFDNDLGSAFRAGFTTDVPTVIVQGTYDTSTPFENAVELLPSFTDHRFVVVHGGSHGALSEALEEDGEFEETLFEFFLSGDYTDVPEEVELPPIEWEAPESD